MLIDKYSPGLLANIELCILFREANINTALTLKTYYIR